MAKKLMFPAFIAVVIITLCFSCVHTKIKLRQTQIEIVSLQNQLDQTLDLLELAYKDLVKLAELTEHGMAIGILNKIGNMDSEVNLALKVKIISALIETMEEYEKETAQEEDD
jgi:hypothetical protein